MRIGREALIVLNPRTIPECMSALDELKIPQIRIIGYTEKQIEETVFSQLLAEFVEYDFFYMVSDDAIVRPYALDAVRKLARAGNPVVTGYSQRTHQDWTVNLCATPLKGDHPSPEAYDFYLYEEIVGFECEEVESYFAGMSLTGMSRKMWERFPFRCFGGGARNTGYASDFSLSLRLQREDIPIMAARDGFCYHWRFDWQTTNGIEDMKPKFDDPRIEVVLP